MRDMSVYAVLCSLGVFVCVHVRVCIERDLSVYAVLTRSVCDEFAERKATAINNNLCATKLFYL